MFYKKLKFLLIYIKLLIIMLLSISNSDYNTFPENLKLDMSIYINTINSNELSFTINMKMFDQTLSSPGPYDISYVGSYFLDTKKLLVSEKNYCIFKDQFYLNGKVLVPDLFTNYILPNISL